MPRRTAPRSPRSKWRRIAPSGRTPRPVHPQRRSVAERLLGPEERAILDQAGAAVVLAALAMDTERAWDSLGNRSVFARGVHVRTRHIDDVLSQSLKTGIGQVVILGAGLDSRAYRFGDGLRTLRVFELDLPLLRHTKRSECAKTSANCPAMSLTCRLISRNSSSTVLDGVGYDKKRKTIFIWEGVTMYILESA